MIGPESNQSSAARTSRVRLDELGDVRGGLVASKTRDDPGAKYVRALLASDVAPDGSIDWDALGHVAAVDDDGRSTITDGDVLLPLRSARVTAVVPRRVPPGVIAIGQWAIVSPEPRLADAEFLGWYLNHPATAVRLASLMRGTKIQFLALTDLRAFEIELPPIETQQRIARLHLLNERITRLEQELAQARKQFVDGATMEALRRRLDRQPE
jgi:hypothetical protein